MNSVSNQECVVPVRTCISSVSVCYGMTQEEYNYCVIHSTVFYVEL